MSTTKKFFWITAICILVFGLVAISLAATVEEMAKKEGRLIFYTSMDSKTANILGENFEKQTGIKVDVFRSGTGKVLADYKESLPANRQIQAAIREFEVPLRELLTDAIYLYAITDRGRRVTERGHSVDIPKFGSGKLETGGCHVGNVITGHAQIH